MNDFEAIKNLSLPEVEQKIEANRKEIKTTRAITYVFDVIIIMVAVSLLILPIATTQFAAVARVQTSRFSRLVVLRLGNSQKCSAVRSFFTHRTLFS